ncbi:SagB/ThcOx family dehydrogenase [Candidatus Margulisiibacteriota bacterium]
MMSILLSAGISADALAKYVKLPNPAVSGKMSVEEAINNRRSVRQFKEEALSMEHISQLLFAAQGITNKYPPYRAAPSAGATYPLELYIVMEDGTYQYQPKKHRLKLIIKKDLRTDLAKAALGQAVVAKAPMDIVICADYRRTIRRYKERGERYVHMEAGHVAENIHLQAAALKLGSVPIGSFHDDDIKLLLNLHKSLTPLYIIPVGHPL